MEIEPYLEKSDLKLDLSKNPYRLLSDNETDFQKLVDLNDPLQKAIVFFPNKIENPSFVLYLNHLLILSSDSAPYLVDLEKKKENLLIQYSKMLQI
jgi:hypothetical protein